MPEVVCVMVHTVALETASLEKIRQTWAKLHYLAIVVLERWYVCARASFACPNGLQHLFCVRENHRTCIRRSLYSRGKNRSVRCNIKLKHALTSSPIKKRNSASQCFPLINCDVAQNCVVASIYKRVTFACVQLQYAQTIRGQTISS